jgi:hypothetical protein
MMRTGAPVPANHEASFEPIDGETDRKMFKDPTSQSWALRGRRYASMTYKCDQVQQDALHYYLNQACEVSDQSWPSSKNVMNNIDKSYFRIQVYLQGSKFTPGVWQTLGHQSRHQGDRAAPASTCKHDGANQQLGTAT